MTAPAAPTWPVIYPADCDLDSITPEQKAAIEEAAVNYLIRMTGGTYGEVPVTVRPCRRDCGTTTFWGRGPYHPVASGGGPGRLGCGSCWDACSCGGGDVLKLSGLVSSVVEVVIDGEARGLSTMRVDNYRLLVDQSGFGWPTCQDMGLPAGEVGTWSVTYLKGLTVPLGGQVAAGALACELSKLVVGGAAAAECSLPSNTVQVSRQGVTVQLDPLAVASTGVPATDNWISMVTASPRGGSVRSVDVAPARVTTWVGTP